MHKDQDLEINICHFDDEPETISWIVDVLMVSYLSSGIEWQTTEESYEENENEEKLEYHFSLENQKDNRVAKIKYLIFKEEKKLHEHLESCEGATKKSIIIIDINNRSEEGETYISGLQLYRDIKSQCKLESIIFLTGYPGKLEDDLNVKEFEENGQLFIKPPDIDSLISKLNRLISNFL